jgi:leucyl aminopeptidase
MPPHTRAARPDAAGVQIVAVPPGAEAADARSLDAGTSPADALRAAGVLARDLPPGRSRVDVTGLDPDRLRAVAEGLVLGCYRFTRATDPAPGPELIELVGAADEAAVARGAAVGRAAGWARDLANTRSDVKTPAWLAAQAVDTLTPLGVEVTVHDEEWLREHRFGGVLAVGGGSQNPPRFVEARWRPRSARQGVHVVLVGKGITFDTGGLNRKTGPNMNTMYTDMSGGADVLGALRVVAEARVPVHVTALVPTAENSFGAGSYRPGDVVRHHGGRTSEIHNTDAEGRLVLADALAWAARTLRPTALVDIATLTGAMKQSLGLRTGGLFATSDPLAEGLLAAGAASAEPLWRLPMPEDYQSLLASSVADATNAPGNPGAITAAMFLRPFAGSVPWAHLDVAGPARAAADDGHLSRGATAFGARLLAAWVGSLALD